MPEERGHHDEVRREHVRRDVPEHDPHRARTDRARGLDVRHLHDGERARTHDTRDARDDRHGDRGDDIGDLVLTGPERRDHGDRNDDEREREQHVHEALDDLIDPPAEVRADDAKDEAERAPDDRRSEADEERGARTEKEPREYVASEVVGAEKMLRRGWREQVLERDRRRVVWGDAIREQRGEDHREHEDQAERTERTSRYELPPEAHESLSRRRLEVAPASESFGLALERGGSLRHEYRMRGSRNT